MSQHQIRPGDEVVHQGLVVRVRAVDGNVLECEHLTGRFYRFLHCTSVHVQLELDLPPAAEKTPAPLAGPAGVAVGGILSYRARGMLVHPVGAWRRGSDNLASYDLCSGSTGSVERRA